MIHLQRLSAEEVSLFFLILDQLKALFFETLSELFFLVSSLWFCTQSCVTAWAKNAIIFDEDAALTATLLP